MTEAIAGNRLGPERFKVIELSIERLTESEVSPFFYDVAQVGGTIELRGPLGGHFIWPVLPTIQCS